jgi:precorrin-6B C5,15-methyltransferase / cobalt-precorrin-6B C5,C15-methyltransferase
MSHVAWLSVIGLGEDGLDGLSPAAARRVSQASLVVGGARHLRLIGSTDGEQMAWPSPLQEAFPPILARRGLPVCVLASGDPFFFGVGSLLAQIIPSAEMTCHPQPSAFSLAASRLGWPLQDCALLSLHGRALDRAIPALQPGARILALSWDGETPAQLARLLVEKGLGASFITVCEAMGGGRERLRQTRADAFDFSEIDPLNTIAVEVAAAEPKRVPPRSPGLPDSWFESDGQLTKSEMRALTLSALAPRPRETLWDVGAGSGSVAIEWLLADPSVKAIAIEQMGERCARIRRNAEALGVSHVDVIEGRAPAILAGLPTPDAVFIGGGFNEPGVFETCWVTLRAGGRLVLNAVTIESQAEAIRRHAALGGSLVQAQFARAAAVGRFHGFRPAMPVVQWKVVKR